MTTTVDTYNWDTVYATHYSTLNRIIANQWKPMPAKFTLTDESLDPPIQYILDATFAPWQLELGGDGKNVQFTCPIQAGSFSVEDSDGKVLKSYSFPTTEPLTQIAIQVGMEWVPDPSQKFFAIADKPTVEAITTALNSQTTIPAALSKLFSDNDTPLGSSATLHIVQSKLEWAIIDNGQYYYILYARQLDNNQQVEAEFLYVYKFEQQWQANLTLLETDIKQGGSAVTVMNVLNLPDDLAKAKTPAQLFEQSMEDWFNIHLGDFEQIFATANITTTLDQTSAYTWLTPTATSYAVTDTNTLEKGIFGILMMTDGRPGLPNHQVSPDAIPGPNDVDPNGCDAAFIISGPRFVQDMLLRAAKQIFNINADDSTYFSVDKTTGMIVTNAKDITWGPFINSDQPDKTLNSSYSTKLDKADLSDVSSVLGLSGSATIQVMGEGVQWLITDGGTEYIIQVEEGDLGVYIGTVSINVPANQFSLSLNGDKVTMKFVNFTYPYTADFTVTVTCEESWTLGLKEVNGKNIFWFTQVSPPKMTTTVTQNKEALTRQGIEGAVAAVLTLITILAPIAEALTATADVTQILNDSDEILEEINTLDLTEEGDWQKFLKLDAQLEDLQAQAEAEIAEFQSVGKVTRIGNTLGAAKWKALAAVLGFAAPAAIDVAVDKIIQSVAGNDPKNYLPKFDDFAEFCIAPYSWPTISGFELASANLANSLVIGLKAKSTT